MYKYTYIHTNTYIHTRICAHIYINVKLKSHRCQSLHLIANYFKPLIRMIAQIS